MVRLPPMSQASLTASSISKTNKDVIQKKKLFFKNYPSVYHHPCLFKLQKRETTAPRFLSKVASFLFSAGYFTVFFFLGRITTKAIV